jgi:hypothetical protein
MATMKSKRLRLQLIHKYDQLAARMEAIAAGIGPAPTACPDDAHHFTAAQLVGGQPTADEEEDDETGDGGMALAECRQLLINVAVHSHAPTMAIFIRALIRELEEFQAEIDHAGWGWSAREEG